MTASLLLANVYQVNVQENIQSAVNTALEIEIPKLMPVSTARTIALLLLGNGFVDESESWVQEWNRLAGDDTGLQVGALWHKGIIHKRRGEWLALILTCDEIMKLDPEHKHIDPSSFRNKALRELQGQVPDIKVEIPGGEN